MDKQELFLRIPVEAIMDKRLSRSALIVYAVMIDAAGKWLIMHDTSIDQIAIRSHMSSRTVRRAMSQLVDAGYIAVHRTGRCSVIDVIHYMRPTVKSTIQAYEDWKDKEAAI